MVTVLARRDSLLARMLARVRRASTAVRRALVLGLLAILYALVLPWFALYVRVFRRPTSGWQHRDDREVASLRRLRQPF